MTSRGLGAHDPFARNCPLSEGRHVFPQMTVLKPEMGCYLRADRRDLADMTRIFEQFPPC
jgi:ABC-type branched-subunit amino acid transport system ATPase component